MVMAGASGKRCRIVNQGRCRSTGSSSCSIPASRSIRMPVLVNSLVMEAIRYRVAAVAGIGLFKSA